MAILVLAEHANTSLKAATSKAVSAAAAIGGDIHLLVIGHDARGAADAAARLTGVTKVLLADAPAYEHLLAESVAPLVVQLARGYTHIVAPATTTGKNVLPRVAAALDVAQVSDVIAIVADDTFVRPIYAGNALATVRSLDPIKVLTVRVAAFAAAGEEGSAVIEAVAPVPTAEISRFVSQDVSISVRPELTSARIVVSGGRGMGNGENFRILEALADRLGAAIGASRAAVDAGFVPNDYQVGQTGKIVAPDLYVAVGISGAIQHIAGMKDSKVVVAINKDQEAPIFQVADYGIVGDLFELVPQLTLELERSTSA
jgi:electron transfer flavoprotein alpha subunit